MANTTIKDIARICGVGVSTVSRAINNHPDINPETKKKIMAVIDEYGFVPNDSARYLKRSESDSIAFLVKGISNPFFLGMVRVMEQFTQKRNYAAILRHVDDDQDEVMVAQALVKERKLKGIVFLGGNFTHDPESLQQISVPYIFCTVGNEDEFELAGRPLVRDSVRYANVAVDDLVAPDFGDLRKAGQDTFTVAVAQSALDVVLGIESRIDLTVFDRAFRKFLYLRGDRRKISCEIHWQPLLSV